MKARKEMTPRGLPCIWPFEARIIRGARVDVRALQLSACLGPTVTVEHLEVLRQRTAREIGQRDAEESAAEVERILLGLPRLPSPRSVADASVVDALVVDEEVHPNRAFSPGDVVRLPLRDVTAGERVVRVRYRAAGHPPSVWQSTVFVDEDPARATARTHCEARGGTWERAGIGGIEQCIAPTSDRGARCLAEVDCQGACLADHFEPLDGTHRAPAADRACRAFQRSYALVGRCDERNLRYGCESYLREPEVLCTSDSTNPWLYRPPDALPLLWGCQD